MNRLQLFELEDQPWFPAVIRDSMTDFLSFTATKAAWVYRPFAMKLAAAIGRTGASRIVDLCSGGSGPSLEITRQVRKDGQPVAELLLTDLYPNLARMRETAAADPALVTIVTDSVDATNVPANLDGFRLVCNGFHHLNPDLAKRCLADAVNKRQGIAVMELVERSPNGLFQVIAGFFIMLLATPFVPPFRRSRLLFTYIVPLIPICTLWDGLVSCLRIYSPAELQSLVGSLPANDYTWDIGRLPVPRSPVRITYLIGTPPAV